MDHISLKEQITLALFNGSSLSSISYRSYDFLYGLFPQVNPAAIRVSVNELVGEGKIREQKINGKLYFALSNPPIYPAKPEGQSGASWDNNFIFAVINVPEKRRVKRARLRELLTKANFRMWQAGIWLSPVSNIELEKHISAENLTGYINFIKGSFILSPEALAKGDLWNLPQLKKTYQELIEESQSLLGLTHFDVIRYGSLVAWEENFLQNIKNDPFFPDEFFELGNLREKVVKMFVELSQKPLIIKEKTEEVRAM